MRNKLAEPPKVLKIFDTENLYNIRQQPAWALSSYDEDNYVLGTKTVVAGSCCAERHRVCIVCGILALPGGSI